MVKPYGDVNAIANAENILEYYWILKIINRWYL